MADRKISGVTGPVAASMVPHKANRPIAGEVMPMASAASPSGLIVFFLSRTPDVVERDAGVAVSPASIKLRTGLCAQMPFKTGNDSVARRRHVGVHQLLSSGAVPSRYRLHQLLVAVVGARSQSAQQHAEGRIAGRQPALHGFDDEVIAADPGYFAVELGVEPQETRHVGGNGRILEVRREDLLHGGREAAELAHIVRLGTLRGQARRGTLDQLTKLVHVPDRTIRVGCELQKLALGDVLCANP